MKYAQNSLEAFSQGCAMDLQMRLAVDLIKSCPTLVQLGAPEASARGAIELAGELLKQGEALGLIEPLTDSTDLPAPLAKQAVRMGKFAAQQQLAGSKEVSAYAGNEIQHARGPLPNGGRPGPRIVS